MTAAVGSVTPTSASASPSQAMASARHKVLLESRIRRAKMENVSAHELSQILRKASLLWAIPANKELLKSAFDQASRTAKHRMTRYELRRHVNSCVLPEPLSHEEVGLLMTWIEPIKEKTIDYETLEAKLAVLLEGLRTYSEKRSLTGYFNEKFHFNEMLATSQKKMSPTKSLTGGSFGTKAEVPPSSKSDSKLPPVTYSAASSRHSPGKFNYSPSSRSEKLNSKTIESLKEGIGELGKKIESMKKEQKTSNFLSSRTKSATTSNLFDVSTTSLLSPSTRDDALTVLKQEFQQIGEKADKIRRQNQNLGQSQQQVHHHHHYPGSLGLSDRLKASPIQSIDAQDWGVATGGEQDEDKTEMDNLMIKEIPTDPQLMHAEIVALRTAYEEEKRAKAKNAEELQATRQVHDQSMKQITSKLQSLESLVTEKNQEVDTLKVALGKAKDDALTAVESEKQHTDDLIKREERLLNTLMTQLNKAQTDQLQLDEYAEEIDKVYDSLEKLYLSLKTESRPLPIEGPPRESTTMEVIASAAAAASSPSPKSNGNPFATSPLTEAAQANAEESSSSLQIEPDVKKQLNGLKAELHALLRVLG